jgi:hypothetical protein
VSEVTALPALREIDGGFPVPLDMTQIFRYEEKIDELTRVNNMTGAFYMQEFLGALDVANSYYSKALFDYESAQAKSKAVHGRLMLDVAPTQLKLKEIRVNEENAKAFCNSHHEYMEAKENEAYLKALVTFLKGKYDKFERAHDDARKIFEKDRPPTGQSSSVPSGR